MPNENFKLRQHHVGSVYGYVSGDEENLVWETWKKHRYTKKEYKRNMACLETVKNLPKDTLIEITAFDDFICEGCTRKHSKRRRMDTCVKPDGNENLDFLFSYSIEFIMGIDVGDAYTLEELFGLMEEYKKINEKLPEIQNRISAGLEYPHVTRVRRELIKEGLVPKSYYLPRNISGTKLR